MPVSGVLVLTFTGWRDVEARASVRDPARGFFITSAETNVVYTLAALFRCDMRRWVSLRQNGLKNIYRESPFAG